MKLSMSHADTSQQSVLSVAALLRAKFQFGKGETLSTLIAKEYKRFEEIKHTKEDGTEY